MLAAESVIVHPPAISRPAFAGQRDGRRAESGVVRVTESVWYQCLKRLESELDERDISTWLRPLQPRMDGGLLVLSAPNPVVLQRVRADFADRIGAALQQLFGDEAPRVEMKVGGAAAAAEPVTEEPVARRATDAPAMGRLNPEHSFDSFVEGRSNVQARAAAQSVAEAPGTKFNPLLIYGETGLGKTHLMSAIGNRIRERKTDAKVLYVGAEKFVRDLVQAIRHGRTEAFKDHYRQVDALLIDDIQFFLGKTGTQEEFFHTFNELLDARQQMVLTSDRFPKDMEGLDERLKSRFTWGLVVAVEPPDFETRVAILLRKAEQMDVRLDEDVAYFVGQRIRHNVRELEGALNRLVATAQFVGRPISVDFARETLRDMIAAYDRLITIDNIQRTVADYFNVRVADLNSARRTRSIARPRQIAMSLCKELTRHSFPEIGNAFGRDHTTVMHAVKQVRKLRETDTKIDDAYQQLTRTLSG